MAASRFHRCGHSRCFGVIGDCRRIILARLAHRLGDYQRRLCRREAYGRAAQFRARISANHPEQFAVKPALEGPQDHLIEVISKLSARRDLTVSSCNSIPHISCVPPRGAFYAFPKIDIGEGDDVFVKELLLQKHILVVHGSGFGQKPGTRHFRIVFLPPEQMLAKAYSEIGNFVKERY